MSRVRLSFSEQQQDSAIQWKLEEYKYPHTTVLHKDDGWRRCTSLFREYTGPRNDKDSISYATIDAYQQIGPVWNIGSAKVIDVHGIEVQVQSLNNPVYSKWILISRGHERFVNEVHTHNNTIVKHSSSLLRREERSDQVNQDSHKPAFGKPMPGPKNSGSVGVKKTPSPRCLTISKTKSDGRDRHIQMYNKKEIPMKDRVWTTILGFPHKSKGNSIETLISKHVTYMVRHCDGDEREHDGAMHWEAIIPILRRKYQSQLKKECTSKDWIGYLFRGSYKTRFEICKDSEDEVVYISSDSRTFRRNDYSARIDELRPDSLQVEEIHLPRARDRYSIAEPGLVAGKKKAKKDDKQFLHTS